MENTSFVLVTEFCQHHHLEIGFIEQLNDCGVLEIVHLEQGDIIPPEAMSQLERMVRLHQELNIHPEDLDIVSDLIDRLERLQAEMNAMKDRLHFFEQQF